MVLCASQLSGASLLDPGDDGFDYVAYDAGCVDLTDADLLDASLAGGLGPLWGFDGVRPIDLGGGRSLWIVQDAFLDVTDLESPTYANSQYANNMVIAWDAQGCGTLLVRPHNVNDRVSFEYGPDDAATWDRFYWPLGGEVHGDEVVVMWAEMQESPKEPQWLDGLRRHPVGTWIARYDAKTLERRSFEPFTEPDVSPQWGFEMTSQGDWTYLYGNANLLNLAMSGGYDNGPHPSTEMFVARVPRGRFDLPLEVFDGVGWTTVSSAAHSLSSRGWASNQMRPRLVAGQFVSIVAVDEFLDDLFIVETAPRASGPWTEASRFRVESDQPIRTVTYHPTLLPSTDPCKLVAVVSKNAADWPEVLVQPSLYRPIARAVDICPGGDEPDS
jgi:hypothetical protein